MNTLLNRVPEYYADKCIEDLSRTFQIKAVILKGAPDKLPSFHRNVHVYSEYDINYNIYEFDSGWYLDETTIKWMSVYEGMYLSIVGKFILGWDASTSENLIKIFYEQINFWLGLIRDNKINLCLSYYSPSDSGSFTLHLACKYCKVTHIFRENSVVANKYQNLSCSLHDRNSLMRQGAGYKDAVAWLQGVMSKIREGDSSTIPFYMDEVYSRYDIFMRKILSCEVSMKFWVRQVRKYLMLTRKNVFYVNGDNISLRGMKPVSFFKINFERWRVAFGLIRLAGAYKKLCSDMPNGKFIFLADSLIPENANTPQALHMRRVEFLIRLLNAVKPHDVEIVYKVNPAQFMFLNHWWMGNRAFLKKKNWFVDLVSKYEIKLMNENADSQQLIKSSIGVASINGSICLESIAHKKHAITLAPVWLDGVYGVHRVADVNDARRVVDLMVEGSFNIEHVDFGNVVGNDAVVFCPKHINYLDFSIEDFQIINRAFVDSIEIYDSLGGEKFSV